MCEAPSGPFRQIGDVPFPIPRRLQVADHAARIDALAEAEINTGVSRCIQQVIALVLRIVHAEVLLDVLGERMDLERQVAALHRIKKVEADGEFVAEAGVYGIAQQGPRLVEHQVQRRQLQPRLAQPQQQAVFFRHAVEAPAVVDGRAVQIADFLHPLPAPGGRIEKGHHAEGPRHRMPQAATHGLAVGQLRLPRVVRVQNEVPLGDQRPFPAIADPPVDEKRTLVLQFRRKRGIAHTEIARPQITRFVAAEAVLAFPSRQVGIDQHVGVAH